MGGFILSLDGLLSLSEPFEMCAMCSGECKKEKSPTGLNTLYCK